MLTLPFTGSVEKVVYGSRVDTPWPDNNRVPALLAYPRGNGSTRLPAVVLLHGYRMRKEQARPAALALQMLGYAVLIPDLPLHGERSIAHDGAFHYPSYGDPQGVVRAVQQASADIASGVEYLEATGRVDASRIAVGGFSLGGCLSIVALADHPHLFRAGVSVVGSARWSRLVGTSSLTPDIRDDLAVQGYGPDELEALYRGIEPTERPENIHRLLMIGAEHDDVVPLACVTETWDRLEHETNRLHIVRGAGHYIPPESVISPIRNHLAHWMQ